jgi:hypothetical protein
MIFELAQQARVLHYYNMLERLARDKHSSLLDPFESYGENYMLPKTTHIVLHTSRHQSYKETSD